MASVKPCGWAASMRSGWTYNNSGLPSPVRGGGVKRAAWQGPLRCGLPGHRPPGGLRRGARRLGADGVAVAVADVDLGERRRLDGDGDAVGRVERGGDCDGGATAGTNAGAGDFALSTATTLTIAAGDTTSTGAVTITAADDDTDSPAKSVTVSGTVAGSSGIVAPTSETLTITDDDAAPGATLALSASSIGESGRRTSRR